MKRILIIILVMLSLTTIIAENPVDVELQKGKNNLSVEEYFPAFPVSVLFVRYPELESVSMQEYGKTHGYIRAFGGVGTNFLIQPGKEYEVYASEPLTINLNSYP